MKRYIAYKAYEHLSRRRGRYGDLRHLRKWLFAVALIFIIGISAISFVSYHAVNIVVDKFTNMVPATEQMALQAAAETQVVRTTQQVTKSLEAFSGATCIQGLIDHANLRIWLERSPSQNFSAMQTSCFRPSP